MALKYVVDFDDLYDEVAERSLTQLLEVKERYPEFKATLFTIPNRTSDQTIKLFHKHRDWLALAPHGYHHTRGECVTWPYHQAEDHIEVAAQRGISAPAFRAPAWVINRPTYEVCRDKGVTVCDHKDNYLHVPGCKVYRYNDPSHRLAKVRPIHGHLTQCAVDNYIGDMLAQGKLNFATGSEFLWVWEAGKVLGEQPGEFA